MKVGATGYISDKETQLTVCKTSLFFAGDGFTAYDCKGQLVFRVDSYGPESRYQHELVLMDASGNCLLTVHSKRPSLHYRWEGYRGDKSDGSNLKPIFSVRRSTIIGRTGVTVEMYSNPGEGYHIEGSFCQRSCTIYDALTREVMGEIRRKVDINVLLGKDVFSLTLKPGFDAAFAMGLVIVCDQICSDGLVDGDEKMCTFGPDPTSPVGSHLQHAHSI